MGGKATNKKGKQKEPTLAIPSAQAAAPPPPPPPAPLPPPPPPPVPSPPAAQHVQHPPITFDTIEEEDEFGGLPVGLIEEEEESWQDVGQSNAWPTNAPGNSNWASGDNDDWETSAHLPTSMPTPTPPQPPPKNSGGAKAHAKQQQHRQLPQHQPQHQLQHQPQHQLQHQLQHQPQHQPQHQLQRQPQHQLQHQHQQNMAGWGAGGGTTKSAATGWNHAKHQQPKDTWNSQDDDWSEDDGQDVREDWANGEDGWEDDNRWNEANDNGWARQPHSAAWAHATSAHTTHSQATSRAPTGGWQNWSEEARRLPKGQQVYPIPPVSGGSLPPTIARNWQQQQPNGTTPPQPHQHGKGHQQHQQQQHFPQHEPQHHYEQHHEHQGKKNKKNKQQQQQQQQQPQQQPQHQSKKSKKRHQEEEYNAWEPGGDWSDSYNDEERYESTHDGWGRKVHFSPGHTRASILPSSTSSIAPTAVVENFTVNALPQNKLGLSTTPMSKTLSYAYSGTTPSTSSGAGRAAMQQMLDSRFVESRGEALKGVQRAFYGKSRKAADRFHWLFPPDKDERVSSLLNWIQEVSFGVAYFGLQKFLQTRERGALIVNADYRPVHSPNEPAFDWITWQQVQATMDRVLQESVGYYNPTSHIIVLVFLPSPSGNSVAMWRRKLPIPSDIRLAYQAQITQVIASLQKEYPVHVDELPSRPKPTLPSSPPKKKRKWYKLWLST